MTMAHYGPGAIPEPPRRPKPAEVKRTPHLLHLVATVVLFLATFGIGGLVWLVVWFVHHLVVDNSNHKEARRFRHQDEVWHAEYVRWQQFCHQQFGFVPPLPFGW
jgi:hypothetical protein